MVDFDLSESKFTMGGFLPTGDSPMNNDKSGGMMGITRQGSDSQMPSAIKQTESHNLTMINRSNTMNKSNGGPDDDLALSMDDTDFGLSESNFSHSMMSAKINQF